ncbi:MAG TPA: NAD(P)H-dependent oxidoreductase [Phycisphaerales bacterium]|nr:NAD(P)H-dependent oxidoreductase [Phycisphaerales bacterium]
MPVKILAFAGSLRRDSYNKKLVKVAARGAERAGATVTYIDLRDYDLPMFDEDYEAEKGLPEAGKRLKDLFREHHGLLVASPEYNSSISGVLKNTIDWLSRPEPNQPPLSAFSEKVAGLMAASPGALGGLRGLVHLRAILGNIQVTVLPDQVAVMKSHEAFDDTGNLKDAKQRESIEKLGEKVARVVTKLRA